MLRFSGWLFFIAFAICIGGKAGGGVNSVCTPPPFFLHKTSSSSDNLSRTGGWVVRTPHLLEGGVPLLPPMPFQGSQPALPCDAVD